ncbi:MAG: leucine-rich repeat protein [Clostridia bacterium]|nr:leucine-rich repeat protein [Clostridia bacterium]
MSLLDLKNIVECQTCGNRDVNLIAERDGGYVCKCCGVWYKKDPTEEEFREQMRCEQGYSQLSAYRFGDARDTFQRILQNNPNSINALWGVLLARFGVVFIKGFYKGVVEPVYCFPNYERMKRRYVQSEPEYAQIMDLLKTDAELRFDYEKKAEKIDDALDSYKEYKASTERDVFICVKISAATERHPELEGRTKDYEFALKIYNELQSRGVNAFYSFVTLENDVKSDEKIWRNLVKSKKMLLIGSSEEYLESPWVKSEWKRWLHLSREEDLYVCVLHGEDESPFDILPQEISDLEPQIYTQDMQDKLIEHICKGLGMAGAANEAAYTPTVTPSVPSAPVQSASANDGKVIYKNGREETISSGITEINSGTFSGNTEIVSIILPKSVKKINSEAFAGCSALESVSMPLGVANIGMYAFKGCESLKSIAIPASVTDIGMGAFMGCGLSEVSVPNGVKTIGRAAFQECRALRFASISESTASIGAAAFWNCAELADVQIANGVKFIEDQAFYGCKSLASIAIPGSVANIGKGVFTGCTSLTGVTMPENITSSIGNALFSKCGSLAGLTLPSGATAIEGWAFEECRQITEITLPEGVASIGAGAFWNCGRLGKISIPRSVTAIEDKAFGGCAALKNIHFGGSEAEWKKITVGAGNTRLTEAKVHFAVETAQSQKKDGKILYSSGRTEVLKYGITEIAEQAYCEKDNIVSVILPSSVTVIGAGAFDSCTSLAGIMLPSSLTVIGEWAFDKCDSLENIYYGGTEDEWRQISLSLLGNDAIENATVNFETENAEELLLSVHIDPKHDGEIVYGDGRVEVLKYGMTEIAEEAYYENKDIVSVILPNSVTSIEYDAFYECSNLASITLSSGLTSIGSGAFSGCSITDITIPNGVKKISESAFWYCSKLASITIPSSVTAIDNEAFNYCESLADVYFGGTQAQWKKISVGKENGPLKRAKVHFEGDEKASAGGTSAASAQAPDTKDGIIVYSDGRTEVLEYGTTEIPENVFVGYTDIVSIVLPEGVKSIGNMAFASCDNLKSIVIPQGLTSIGQYAFKGCESLKSITIPSSVTSIGNRSFYGCHNIKDIYYGGTQAQWKKISVGEENEPLKKATVHFEGDEKASAGGTSAVSAKAAAGKDGKIVYSDGRVEVLEYGITKIKERAYYGHKDDIISVALPESVTAIERFAFYDCRSLKSIEIPGSVTTIAGEALGYCMSLTSIEIPGSVTEIGEKAFTYCTSLENIKLPSGITAISAHIFDGCSSLASITIPKNVTSIGEYAFYNCNNLASIEIPSGVSEIGKCAFCYCTNLASIELPDGLTQIDSSVFSWCKSLAIVNPPSGITSIGAYAFEVCKSLTSIRIPRSVTVIGEEAFNICNNLNDIYYEGSKSEWARISIGKGNAKLTSLFGKAKIHYNSK